MKKKVISKNMSKLVTCFIWSHLTEFLFLIVLEIQDKRNKPLILETIWSKLRHMNIDPIPLLVTKIRKVKVISNNKNWKLHFKMYYIHKLQILH